VVKKKSDKIIKGERRAFWRSATELQTLARLVGFEPTTTRLIDDELLSSNSYPKVIVLVNSLLHKRSTEIVYL
jgi:hypothetical protein